MIRNLLFVFLSIIYVSALPVEDFANCESLSVTVDIRPARKNAYVVKVKVENGSAPLHYVFYRKNGALLSENFTSNTVTMFEKGVFYYAVVDSKGCKVKSEFKIE